MNRIVSFAILSVFLILSLGGTLRAQDDASPSATCNFDEEKQLMVQYQRVPINLKKPVNLQVPFGKVWAPGGKAMTLFTNTPVQIGSKELPIGAYTLFVVPNSKQWTLIVSKSTDTSGAYDQVQDLVRVPMDSGELPSPEPNLSVSFAHVAPQQCNIRIDLDKFGHFAEFHQK
jgi:Protein of unknown function (DUF2911)